MQYFNKKEYSENFWSIHDQKIGARSRSKVTVNLKTETTVALLFLLKPFSSHIFCIPKHNWRRISSHDIVLKTNIASFMRRQVQFFQVPYQV